jgi:hypothetical protein
LRGCDLGPLARDTTGRSSRGWWSAAPRRSSIADPTADAIAQAGFTRVGLLGTRFTMEEDFYRQRLESRHGIEALVPPPEDRNDVHRILGCTEIGLLVGPQDSAVPLFHPPACAQCGAEGAGLSVIRFQPDSPRVIP